MKLNFCFFVFVCFILLDCNKKPSDSVKYVEYLNNGETSSSCAYAFNKVDNALIQYICQNEGQLNGDLITYYPGGRIKSLRTYHLDTLIGRAIDYYETGLIKRIYLSLDSGVTTEIKSFDSNGFLNEISFTEHDSLYYARKFLDTSRIDLFTNFCKPLMILERDTFFVHDTVDFHIRFPLPKAYDLPSLGFQLRYDRFPISIAQGKNPFAEHSTALEKEDIYIGITSDKPSADRFVYYVTDTSGIVISPILYKDVYFIEKK